MCRIHAVHCFEQTDAIKLSAEKLVEDVLSEEISNEEKLATGLDAITQRWLRPKAPSVGSRGGFEDFYTPRPPLLKLKAYILRLQQHVHCSEECFIMAFVYISKISERDPSLVVCDRSIQRLILACLVLAVKTHDDMLYDNALYASIGGVSLEKLNKMEMSVLTALGWNTFVKPNEYQYYHGLVHHRSYGPFAVGEPEPEP